MTKQDKIHSFCRKLDYLYMKKGYTFCKAFNELLQNKVTIDLTDDEIIELIKDISPDEKQIKD